MKKTLIALAVVAASGAAFAQSTVTIGGAYNFGFQRTDSGAAKADFFDAKVNLSGTEDIGGGLKASFATEMQLGGRANLAPATPDTKDSNVWGRNATVSLAGGFGTVTGGRVENTNTHQSAQVAGASLDKGFDQAGIAGALANYNLVQYTSPAFSGATVYVNQAKLLNADFAPNNTTANNETVVNSLGLNYANGPLAAGVVFKSVLAQGTTVKSGTKTELFATYDFKVVKAGLGYGKNAGDRFLGADNSDESATWIASVVAPIGSNLTVGMDYATRAAGGLSSYDTTKAQYVAGRGTALAVNYMLSKRTKINATVGKTEGAGLMGNDQYRVGLFHSF